MNKSAQVYLFVGGDEFLLVQDAKRLVNSLVPPEEQTLGLEVIEGRARNTDEAGASLVRCIETLRTPGFMGSRKVVWLRGANYLDRGIIARSNEVKELLASLIGLIAAGLPKGNSLVVTSNEIDKGSGLLKALRESGAIYQQEDLKPAQREKAAFSLTRELLRKNNLQAAPEIVTTIVELVGTDSRQLFQEVSKLAVFVHPRQKVDEKDVRAVITAARESNAMHLADAVGARNLPAAVALLRQLLFQKENAIGIVSALEARFRYLLLLQAEAEEGEQMTPLLASEKGRPLHPYFASRLRDQAKLFSGRELAACRQVLLETRLQLVSTSGLDEILLERLLVKLCRRQKFSRRSGC